VKIGILGGTFDPVHNGHIVLAYDAMKGAHLDKVIFLPCNIPPHKGHRPVASGEDRYRMLNIAVDKNPSFEVSRIELDRSGPSYSVETLKDMKKIIGKGDNLYFIIGSDSSGDLKSWKDFDKLSGLATFIVASRPGYDIGKLPAGSQVVPSKALDVSSSGIRAGLKEGTPQKGLIPEGVESYITDKGLYGR